MKLEGMGAAMDDGPRNLLGMLGFEDLIINSSKMLIRSRLFIYFIPSLEPRMNSAVYPYIFWSTTTLLAKSLQKRAYLASFIDWFTDKFSQVFLNVQR